MRALPLTLTLSPKGRGDRSSAVVNMAQVFSLSLWERAGVRASARTITHLRIPIFTPLLTGTIYR
ncbi:hypothetical protein JNE120442_02750 [Escherichia coli]|nr:hypothetical protein JNE120442_02750 [Escherichia coli]